MTESLIQAAQAVIDRWDSPSWKDLPATANYIHALRKAVAEANRCEISVGDEQEIKKQISEILGVVAWHQRTAAIYATIKPYLRQPEPVIDQEACLSSANAKKVCPSETAKNESQTGQPVQELVNLKVLGLSVQEIFRLKSWFENKSGKNITEFWEEAFNAGIKTARHLSQPERESGIAIKALKAIAANPYAHSEDVNCAKHALNEIEGQS